MMTFSKRHGHGATEAEITIREDAPEDLRYAVAQIAVDCGMSPKSIRAVVCQTLLVAPNLYNHSQYPNIWDEVGECLRECDWPEVYDIVEAIYKWMDQHLGGAEEYMSRINSFFRKKGIGWKLTEDNGITYRGGDTFAAATENVSQVLEDSGRPRAASEIREAIRDISRRPMDITGALQHAMAAVECTAKDVLEEPNATLGKLVCRLGLPKPLDTAVDKLWGFASNRARHVKEGDGLEDTEAELVVSVACAVCTFLAKKVTDDDRR